MFPQQLKIYLTSAHCAVIFAIAQLSCYYCWHCYNRRSDSVIVAIPGGFWARLGGQMKKFSRLANVRHNPPPPYRNQLIFALHSATTYLTNMLFGPSLFRRSVPYTILPFGPFPSISILHPSPPLPYPSHPVSCPLFPDSLPSPSLSLPFAAPSLSFPSK